jgi:lactase-phlorizin hydrolase
VEWKEPNDPSNPDDVAAAEREMHMTTGTVANPIFGKDGDWPQVIKDLVAEKSKAQGLKSSRLPEFTQKEIVMIRGKTLTLTFSICHYYPYLAKICFILHTEVL